jgi:hypothetical protein
MFRRLSNTVLVISVQILFTLKSDFLVSHPLKHYPVVVLTSRYRRIVSLRIAVIGDIDMARRKRSPRFMEFHLLPVGGTIRAILNRDRSGPR